MKKLLFMFIALSVMLPSCSWFDSEPINPKIIGTGNIQYNTKSELWYVVVDSSQFTVTQVTIRDNNPHAYGTTQKVSPVEGMLVTIFTSERMLGLQAVTGRQSVEQIEELYYTNDTGVVILLGFLLLCIVICLTGVSISRKERERN